MSDNEVSVSQVKAIHHIPWETEEGRKSNLYVARHLVLGSILWMQSPETSEKYRAVKPEFLKGDLQPLHRRGCFLEMALMNDGGKPDNPAEAEPITCDNVLDVLSRFRAVMDPDTKSGGWCIKTIDKIIEELKLKEQKSVKEITPSL